MALDCWYQVLAYRPASHRLAVVFDDITERKRAEAARTSLEAQLRESQKMQAVGTLAGGIAHDFNNIIATILGNAELARQDASTNRLVLESIEQIRKAGTRGARHRAADPVLQPAPAA